MSIALIPIAILMLILLVFILTSIPKETRLYMAKKIAIIILFVIAFIALFILMPSNPT